VQKKKKPRQGGKGKRTEIGELPDLTRAMGTKIAISGVQIPTLSCAPIPAEKDGDSGNRKKRSTTSTKETVLHH